MKTALVCIAKDEDDYIDEWVLYHHKLGFDDIHIYENNWKCKLDYPFLIKTPFPGKTMQMVAYNHFLTTYNFQYDWVGIFDCDEYLVLKVHNNVQEFLKDYDNPRGIGINWQLYGSQGKEKKEKGQNSLIKQFTYRQNGVDKHIKSILKLPSKAIMRNPHSPNIAILDTNRFLFTGPFNTRGNSNIAVINHYYFKTYDEWLLKCKRGRSDVNEKKLSSEWIENKDKDIDVEDCTAYNFMYGT